MNGRIRLSISVCDTGQINGALTVLDLSGVGPVQSQISDTEVGMLAHALQSNYSLAELDLRLNRIGPGGAHALADMLRGNSALTALHLGENPLCDAGGVMLARAMQSNGTIQTISLGGTQLGDASAVEFAAALEVRTLLSVQVFVSDVCSVPSHQRGSTTQFLCNMPQRNTSLQSLDFFKNSIGAEGGIALGRALTVRHTSAMSLPQPLPCQSIRTPTCNSCLVILCVHVSAEVEVLWLTQINRTLTQLFLYQNHLGDAGAVVRLT